MAVEVHTSEVVTRISAKVELIKVEADLWLYRQELNNEVLTKGKRGTPLLVSNAITPGQIIYGITNDVGRRNLLKGKPVAQGKRPLAAFTKGALEAVRQKGYDAIREFWLTPEQAFEQARLKEDAFAPEDFIHVDWSSGMVYDRAGAVLPAAVRFDYCLSQIDESHYPLPALLKALAKRKDIRLEHNEGSTPGLFSIPYYNESPGHTQSVEFTWVPTRAVYEKVWAHCQKMNPSYPSTSFRYAIMDLDILHVKKLAYDPPREAPDQDED